MRGSCVFYTSDEIAFDVIGFDFQKEAGWDISILGCTSYWNRQWNQVYYNNVFFPDILLPNSIAQWVGE